MSEFQRIFLPRTNKAVKAISLLTNGVRYNPTPEETADAFNALKGAVNDLAEAYGILPTPEEAPAPESRVEASRIDAKVASIKASAFAREDVHANVMSIPEAQLTAYASYILARLCAKFDEPEAQPKNYVVKDPDGDQ